MRGKAYGRYRPSRDAGANEQDRNAWLVTYADAVTLLLAFFVLLYTFADVDMERFSELLEGLRVPFGNAAADGILDGTDQPLPPSGKAIGSDDREALIEELSALDAQRLERVLHDLSTGTLQDARARAQAEAQLDAVEAALDNALEHAGLADYVRKIREDRGLIVSVSSDDILFATGSTTIDPLGEDVIRIVSDTLAAFPNDIQVEGHTDNVPISRPDYTNWNLSTDRAVAVLSLMIERHGLPPDRVGAVGYGEYHPAMTNSTPEGRARNRRVDIVILLEGQEASP